MMTVRINCWLSALIRSCLRAACLLWRQRAGYFTVCVQNCANAVSLAALVVFNHAVMDRLKSMIRPLADIYSQLRVNFPASLFLSTLNSSHFLLGNRWETGRRGNEQEERQTLCKQWWLLKKMLISPSVCVYTPSYRNCVVCVIWILISQCRLLRLSCCGDYLTQQTHNWRQKVELQLTPSILYRFSHVVNKSLRETLWSCRKRHLTVSFIVG